MSFVSLLHRVCNRENLNPAQAQLAMDLILAGEASTPLIAGFLIALRMKGETADELLGFARSLRARAVHVDAGSGPILDTCGTGGDGACTFNVSTVVAFVVAGAGVRVAKHGNRSISSQCGSADILEALGVNVNAPPELMGRAIRETGIGFLFAPAIHPAFKHAQPARAELKMRTAFNLLGPLTNPAGATAQLVGAPTDKAADLIAEALASLGLQRGFVVHGTDGLDEITTTGDTNLLEIRRGAIAHQVVTPEDFGVPRAKLEDLQGGDKETNREIALAVLNGEKGAPRDIVLVNASAALVVAGAAPGFREGVELAAASIDSGSAATKLRDLALLSQEAAQPAGRS